MAQHRQLRSLDAATTASPGSSARRDSSVGLESAVDLGAVGRPGGTRDVPLRLTRRVSGKPRLLGLDSRLRRPA
ncbi:hypothetical protein [Pseudonocardia sp. KRD291]|uniref:hypothetical protein n=1 Tax=Pseudonocardia sp. KRD291 TaxID=2792007 RepID=UPI001C4A5C6B|nr:hypothetical protein [Pseudonocardia sp. KRD291]MBW0104380.1 hypothetical protein [Pseudonocardia sp. KRD291]